MSNKKSQQYKPNSNDVNDNIVNIVQGYIRLNYSKQFTKAMVKLINTFYLIPMNSQICDSTEQTLLLSLLNPNISAINLLYRASDHGFSAGAFHDFCDCKGPTIVIIHNEFGYVFGGYTSISWNCKYSQLTDPNAFLFVLRPTVKCFSLSSKERNGENVLWCDNRYGPTFGKGCDLFVSDGCYWNSRSCVFPRSFQFSPYELCGGYGNGQETQFSIADYEVFQIKYC
eukprot:301158_1